MRELWFWAIPKILKAIVKEILKVHIRIENLTLSCPQINSDVEKIAEICLARNSIFLFKSVTVALHYKRA